MSTIGGLLCGALLGFKIPKVGKLYPGYQVKPLFKAVRIPPIIGMLILGCIARNFFGESTQAFPKIWA